MMMICSAEAAVLRDNKLPGYLCSSQASSARGSGVLGVPSGGQCSVQP